MTKPSAGKVQTLKERQMAPLVTPTDLRAKATKDIAAAMNAILADVFALYLKTKNFHWHMSGPHFRDYHLLLDEQADQLNGIAHPVELVGLLIEQQVVVAEVRSAHVPMEILGLEIQGPDIGEDGIHASGDVLGCLGAKIARRHQRRRAPSLQLLLLRFAHCHGQFLDVSD